MSVFLFFFFFWQRGRLHQGDENNLKKQPWKPHRDNVPGDKFPSHINLDGLYRFAAPSSRLFSRRWSWLIIHNSEQRWDWTCIIYIKKEPPVSFKPWNTCLLCGKTATAVFYSGSPIASVWVIRGVKSAKTFVIIQWTSRTGFATMSGFKKRALCLHTAYSGFTHSLLQGLGQMELLVQVDFGIFQAIFPSWSWNQAGKTKQMKNKTQQQQVIWMENAFLLVHSVKTLGFQGWNSQGTGGERLPWSAGGLGLEHLFFLSKNLKI